MAKGDGLRFNEGKNRYDLLPAFAIEEFTKVFTKGAEKYAERNWEKGMDWSKVLASMKRHIAAFEKGEDFDKETGLYHLAHAMVNASFLLEYYKIYPEGDDRPHWYLNNRKIGLDIDDVLAGFCQQWSTWFNAPYPTSWHFDKDMMKKLEELKDNKEFWLTMPVLIKPEDIPFEPVCYVTSRIVDSSVTEEWLEKNGFPMVPVYTVGPGKSKVEVLKASGVDIFVDDKFENFVELNKNGICTYLLDAIHNQRYNVGYKRIKSLKELLFV